MIRDFLGEIGSIKRVYKDINLDKEKFNYNRANSAVTLNLNLYAGLIYTHNGKLDSAKHHLKNN